MNDFDPSDAGYEQTIVQDPTTVFRPPPPPPSNVPPGYAFAGELGRGGMGVVFRATDLAMNREVAIKVLHEKYAPGSSAAARFVEEAQIAGRLQHPGIPAVHQVGTLADGRPFLAMKLIKGRSLERMLQDGEPVSAYAVVDALAQAIGYAHAQGVVHRDLKPANVMVGTFGEVQVVDWGLAKSLSAVCSVSDRPKGNEPAYRSDFLTDRDSHGGETQAGSVLGTPAYMAPEQATGDVGAIDARTDVFGLGGILCRLLTGAPPFVGDSAESTRQLSARGELTEVFTKLDRCDADPEWVALCKRCLAVNPAERPANGAAVAKVIARLRNAAEERARVAELDRVRAEVRDGERQARRRVLTYGAMALAFVFLVGLIGTVRGLLDARSKAALAEASRNRAFDVLDAVSSTAAGDTLAAQKDLSPQQRQFLSGLLSHYRALAEEQPADRPTRLRVAAAALRVGAIENRLGRTAEAEAAFRQSYHAYSVINIEDAGNLDAVAGLARAANGLAVCAGERGDRDDEIRYAEEAMLRQTAVAEARPEDADAPLALATYIGNVANHRLRARKPDEAEAFARKALATLEPVAAARPNDPAVDDAVARAHNLLGVILKNTNRRAEALTHYTKASDLWSALAERNPGDPEFANQAAGVLHNLGNIHKGFDKKAEAEAAFRKGLAMREKLVAEYPSSVGYRLHYGAAFADYGNFVRTRGEPMQSLPWFDKAFVMLTPHETLATAKQFLRNAHANRAGAYDELDRFADAAKDWTRALELAGDGDKSGFRLRRADSLVRAGNVAEALNEANELLAKADWPAPQWYDLACVFAVASKSDPSHAPKAALCLTNAVKAGWKDLAHFAEDHDWDPIRGREEVKAALARVMIP